MICHILFEAKYCVGPLSRLGQTNANKSPVFIRELPLSLGGKAGRLPLHSGFGRVGGVRVKELEFTPPHLMLQRQLYAMILGSSRNSGKDRHSPPVRPEVSKGEQATKVVRASIPQHERNA